MASTESIAVSPNTVRGAFANRTAWKPAVDTKKKSLPSSPRKKVAVVAALVSNPSRQQFLQLLGWVYLLENEEEVQMASLILQDATAALQTTKRKWSNDARTATQVSLSFLCGEK